MRKHYNVSLVVICLFICTTSATGTASVATASEDILLLEQETQSQSETSSKCFEKVDPGPCKSFVHKWYYDSETKTCRTFIFGGCEGNGNRFDIEAECLVHCGGSDHTLPPYLEQRTSTSRSHDDSLSAPSVGTTSPSPPRWRKPTLPTPPPVPLEQRGVELTFEETGHQKVFMFAQANTFIQLDNNKIPTFQLRLCREIRFDFRTRLPHGLLVYHSVKGRPDGLEPYALYITVQNGQLKVVHVFGKYSTSLTVGQGLNRDQWHSVSVLIDVHGARLMATVDDKGDETHIQGVQNSYGVHSDLQSVVLIGGLNPEERLHGVKYIIESFVGCIRNIQLSAGKAASDLLPIKPLVASQHENIVEGCINLCRTSKALCFFGSKCINHYHSYTCDCFGMKFEGEYCDTYTATVLTMRGSSYVSYRVYDWKDRVHSISNRVSMFFKTRFDDSALFYASGEQDHYAAASLINGTVQIDLNLGDGAIKTTLGEDLTDNHWHNLTIFHYRDQVTLVLDHEAKLLELPGSTQFWYIDPEIYIGGGPDLGKKDALQSKNNFAGNLKYVYYNDVNILYELKLGNQKVHYIGVLEAEFKEADVEVIPITFPFPKAHIWWPNDQPDTLAANFDFKISNRTMAVLLSSDVTTSQGHGFWELRIVNGEIRFELYPDHAKNVTHLTTIKFDTKIGWHSVDLQYNNGELRLTVDYKNKMAQLFGLQFKLGDKFLIGSGDKTNSGMVGCMRDIRINGYNLEPRFIVRSKYSVGDVSLDDCRLVDPCLRPDACEHGGKCRVEEDRLKCDCADTGYIGNNCHFAYFKKTCEELALLGYTKPDVYLIDIDGNGRFPPAHVKCEFQSLEDSTKTIVEHNLPSQVDVRSSSDIDFRFSIKYREFTAEMLQELISHSLHCSQYIKYDCYKAPLELHSATWFTSSAEKDIVDYIGNVKKGACPCSVNKTCISAEHTCNCDISEGKWHSDEGYFITPSSLGITEMVFLQQRELDNDAQGRITLGPLECVETNTQRYVVTFTSSQSFIEVPGWRKGDISFSFRTTGEKAILLYQPPIRKGYPSFMLALISDLELMFNFTLNTGRARELIVRTKKKLNNGEWQKLWIDYNEHHVRFTINTDYRMDDLLPEEQFGPFEGSMFIGGAPEDHLQGTNIHQGLIGCFRGLVVNGIILDIYSYMSVHLSEIIKDCKPACDPNPCRNGATCRELWSTYECVCENPWAHLGVNCENNINSKSLTFMTRESYLKKNYLANVSVEEKGLMRHIMVENILVNLRTFDNHSLVLYANDNVNNFVQIHLDHGRFVVFMFNYGNQIQNITVEYPELNSGKSVQIAIERKEKESVLHVNEIRKSIPFGVRLLTLFSNKPWINPQEEILAPMRPPAPPTEYFQINLGGYDRNNLITKNNHYPQLDGYVGCIRGLKIGNHLFDLSSQIENTLKKAFAEFVDMAGRDTLTWMGFRQIKGKFNVFQREKAGVVSGCRMRCDEKPCKNAGVCYEDFQKGESSCNCEHTSYFGEYCDQEKGADFGGESVLQRKFSLKGIVDEVKVQLAFSTSDFSQKKSILLLVQSDNSRSYYLLVALTTEGHLIFEEDREGERGTIGSRVKVNFREGSRHSVYFHRINETATLLVDREEIILVPLPIEALSEQSGPKSGTNEVQIGGIITNDLRFASYGGYSGCLSNVFVEVNGESMKPLEEYMLFTKTGSDTVHVQNAPGVRSAQCAPFELNPRPKHLESSLNLSLARDKGWVEDPPAKIPYTSLYMETSTEEDQSTRVIFITLVSFFVFVVLGALYEVFRTHRKYKHRRDEEVAASILWPKGQPTILKPTASIKPNLAYKQVPQHDKSSRAVSLTGSNPSLEKKSSLPRIDQPRPSLGGNSIPISPLSNGTTDHKQNGSVTFSDYPQNKSQDLINLDKSLEELSRALHDTLQGECDDSELVDEGGSDETTVESPERVLLTAGFVKRENVNPDCLQSIDEDSLDKRETLDNDGPRMLSKPLPQGCVPRVNLPPIFLNEDKRTFHNPISYLGGPRFDSSGTRASKESVLSLD